MTGDEDEGGEGGEGEHTKPSKVSEQVLCTTLIQFLHLTPPYMPIIPLSLLKMDCNGKRGYHCKKAPSTKWVTGL